MSDERLGLSEQEFEEYKQLVVTTFGESCPVDYKRYRKLSQKTVETKMEEVKRNMRLKKINRRSRL